MIFRLLEEVLDSKQLYNRLLRTSLEDQKDQTALLKSTIEKNQICVDRCKCCRADSNSDHGNSPDDDSSDSHNDLIEWLRSIRVDEQSIKKVGIFQNYDYFKGCVQIISTIDLNRMQIYLFIQ